MGMKMEHKLLDKCIVDIILEEVNEIRKECGTVNVVIRDEVFSILESKCTVLYYPIEDNELDGYRVARTVEGKEEQFVFINTANPEEKQIFAAAHELGHILQVDDKVIEKLQQYNKKGIDFHEAIISRFAAELLVEKDIFQKLFTLKILDCPKSKAGYMVLDLIKIVVFLMDYFLVPYKTIVKRLVEIEWLSQKDERILLKLNDEVPQLLRAYIKEGAFIRLEHPTNIKAFGDLPKYLGKLANDEKISRKKLQRLREMFDLEEYADIPTSIHQVTIKEDIGEYEQ